MISAKILINCSAGTAKKYLRHLQYVKHHGIKNKYPEFEEETFRILNTANVGGIDYH